MQESPRDPISSSQPYIPSPEITSAASTGTVVEDRIFVDRKPEDLMNFFQDHTSVNARKLLEVYIGKCMRLTGMFDDVRESPEDLFVCLNLPQAYRVAFLKFEAEWHDRLAMIQRGTSIAAIGRIASVTLADITLHKCELVNPPADHSGTTPNPSTPKP